MQTRHKSFILLHILAALTLHSACNQSRPNIGADRSRQHAPAILSVSVKPTESGSAQVYVLNQPRGMLEPIEQNFPITANEPFLAFGIEAVIWNGVPAMRLQIQVEPLPKFIFVSEIESIEHAGPVSPDFVSFAKADCPLFSIDRQNGQRLYPSSRLTRHERVFLFEVSDEPFVNIILEGDWEGMLPMWWVPRSCIDHPSLWVHPPNDDVSALYLGASDAPFVRQLATDFGVRWNLRLSDREGKRRTGDSCNDILTGLPHVAPVLVNYTSDEFGNQFDHHLAAAVYVCAEYVASEQRYEYQMRPSLLTLPASNTLWPGESAVVELLVFNLSPSHTVGFGAQAWGIETYTAFGESAFDEEDADEDEADEADEEEPEDPELFAATVNRELEIYALEAGVDQAIWVQLYADPEASFLDTVYAVGPNPANLIIDGDDEDSGEEWFMPLQNRGQIMTVP